MISLDHINLNVKNLEESLKWYQQVFEFHVVERKEHKGKPYAIVRNGSSMLCMYEEEAQALPHESKDYKIYHFGLRIRDREHWLSKLKTHKVPVRLEWDYPHSKSWYVIDPTGHEIEVCLWNDDKIQFDPMTT